MKLLIVDDEELIRNVIKEYAKLENFEVDEAEDGDAAIEKALSKDYDVIVMDIMMPKRDGFSAIREIKKIKDVPVIVLSARTMEEDKLNGFNLGIDDYVIKPFSPKELIARIKAVTKRQKGEDIISVGTIKLNNLTREVSINDEIIELTHTQFELLKLFLTNLNIALTREVIINKIWGYDYEADDRTIDAHIKLLRSKLKNYRDNIKTSRKVGYKFEYRE